MFDRTDLHSILRYVLITTNHRLITSSDNEFQPILLVHLVCVNILSNCFLNKIEGTQFPELKCFMFKAYVSKNSSNNLRKNSSKQSSKHFFKQLSSKDLEAHEPKFQIRGPLPILIPRISFALLVEGDSKKQLKFIKTKFGIRCQIW